VWDLLSAPPRNTHPYTPRTAPNQRSYLDSSAIAYVPKCMSVHTGLTSDALITTFTPVAYLAGHSLRHHLATVACLLPKQTHIQCFDPSSQPARTQQQPRMPGPNPTEYNN